MLNEIIVSFAGPFSWPGTPDARSVFDVAEGRKAGIYLWTVPQPNDHLIFYVGETGRSFGVRLIEHFKEHAAAMYSVCSPAEFARGEKIELWPGHFGPSRRSRKDCVANYPRLCEQIAEMTLIFRFFLAPLSCDPRVRQRIEAAITQSLRDTSGTVGTFQYEGVRYHPRKKDEEPIACVASSPVILRGLPDRFRA